jgi:hypothetical protein
LIHRDNDQPVVIKTINRPRREWWQQGHLHRNDMTRPVVIWNNGKKLWYMKGSYYTNETDAWIVSVSISFQFHKNTRNIQTIQESEDSRISIF